MANPRILIVGIIFLTNSTVTADPLPRTDALGDPLPDFALARSGSVRWRHGGLIDALAVSTDGTLIASHGVGDAVRVWDAKTGKPVRQFPAGPWGSHALAFSPDGKQLALAVQVVADVEKVGGRKPVGTFFRWDLRTGQEMERSDGFPGIS